MAKEMELEAYNGDVEIEGLYYGCKRRKVVPSWVLPEKEESGVVFRADRMEPYISIPLERYLLLVAALNDLTNLGIQPEPAKDLV